MDATMHRACLFYALAGAAILNRHYKRNAVPVVGAAFLRVCDATDSVLGFGAIESDTVISRPDAFHAWVECDGMLIDFMAPIFGEVASNIGSDVRVPIKMLQRPIKQMSSSVDKLAEEGDFFLYRNPELTAHLYSQWAEKAMYSDLVEICVTWYTKPPKRINPQLTITDDLGNLKDLKLGGISIGGKW
jgi:hypothetical protein